MKIASLAVLMMYTILVPISSQNVINPQRASAIGL